jgi:hypothetical protein
MEFPCWRHWLKQFFGFNRSTAESTRIPRRSRPWLEQLEDRLTPSDLSLTGGTLTYVATANETNNLTVSFAAGTYTFYDTGATITAPTSAGWSGNGTSMVTVATGAGGVGTVSGIAVDLSANANKDTLTVDNSGGLLNTTINFTGGSGTNSLLVTGNAGAGVSAVYNDTGHDATGFSGNETYTQAARPKRSTSPASRPTNP